MIAGFDPSLTHLGWVLFDTNSNKAVEGGVFKTSPSDGLLIQRIITQREKVRLFIVENKIDFIAMEAPYWGSYSTEILFALNQHLHEIFLNLNIYVVYFQPLSIKSYAIPKMKSDEITKHHMTFQAKKELGKQGRRFSEHVADAYFVGKLGLRYYQWLFEKKFTDDDLTPKEHDMFCGKHTFVKGVKKGLTEYTGIIYRENEQFFDYRRHSRNTKIITEEITNGGIQALNSGRVF